MNSNCWVYVIIRNFHLGVTNYLSESCCTTYFSAGSLSVSDTVVCGCRGAGQELYTKSYLCVGAASNSAGE